MSCSSLMGVLNIGDWILWAECLDLQGYVKRMKALKKKFDRFHDHVYNEHKANMKGGKDFVSKNIVELPLQLAEDPDIEVKLNIISSKQLPTFERIRQIQTVTTVSNSCNCWVKPLCIWLQY
ncbi:hypothetical protein ACFX12_018158 [Malus domestica]